MTAVDGLTSRERGNEPSVAGKGAGQQGSGAQQDEHRRHHELVCYRIQKRSERRIAALEKSGQ